LALAVAVEIINETSAPALTFSPKKLLHSDELVLTPNEKAIQGTTGAARPSKEEKNRHDEPTTASVHPRMAFCCSTEELVPGGAITTGEEIRATTAITATMAIIAITNVTPKPAPKD
jgi:hypothetical protein